MLWRGNYRTWSPLLPGIQCAPYTSAMETTGSKIVNDSVHGHIILHPLLVRVIDTPEFQRLRNIKQLGPANYVFPGAGHSRFEHSLGTCYLAGQMVGKLMSREAVTRCPTEVTRLSLCVQLAALCHDLGHGPFSHTWERVTSRWNEQWKHETSSLELFDYLLKKHDIVSHFAEYHLQESDPLLIKQLIMGGAVDDEPLVLPSKDNFLYEIVSNKRSGIDVDKWDYFLRDGLHLNLNITFDYRRILEFCTILPKKGESESTCLAFRDKEVKNLYDMFRVRSAMHHTAYRHRVVIGIELMLVDAFDAAARAGYRINNSGVLLKDAHKRPESMREFTDHVFYDILYSREPSLTEAQAILERILRRELYKFVEKTNIPFPDSLPLVQRKIYIEEQKEKLLLRLKQNECHLDFCVGEFYVDLDAKNNPVSNVTFYKKSRVTNDISEVSFEDLKPLLESFPFQLRTETMFELLVFCTCSRVPEDKLHSAKRIVLGFSP